MFAKYEGDGSMTLWSEGRALFTVAFSNPDRAVGLVVDINEAIQKRIDKELAENSGFLAGRKLDDLRGSVALLSSSENSEELDRVETALGMKIIRTKEQLTAMSLEDVMALRDTCLKIINGLNRRTTR